MMIGARMALCWASLYERRRGRRRAIGEEQACGVGVGRSGSCGKSEFSHDEQRHYLFGLQRIYAALSARVGGILGPPLCSHAGTLNGPRRPPMSPSLMCGSAN
jgi:hypothetical protein